MSQLKHIMATGASAIHASAINGGMYSTTNTAAGTTKATATVLGASKNYVSITSSGKGVALPGDTQQGDDIDVYNGGANTLLVYTPAGSTDTITTGSANGGFSVATMKSARFSKVTSSLWMVNYSA